MRRRRSSQNGVALVELAIVIIPVLILAMGAIELGRTIRTQMVMNSLAEELAFSLLKNCENIALIEAFNVGGTTLPGCVAATTATMMNDAIAAGVVSDPSRLQIWSSVWRKQPFSAATTAFCNAPVLRIPGVLGRMPSFTGALDPAMQMRLTGWCNSQHFIAFTEAAYEQQPIVPFMGWISSVVTNTYGGALYAAYVL